jgi:pyruvate dehydrogenase E2 component (dihydrolipoamide acetyltransferase)
MAVPVILPKLEMMMEAGTIVRWLAREGEAVEQGQPIVEIETDKVNMEIEAPAPGVLAGIRAQPGEEVPVTRTIAYIVQPGERVPVLEDAPSPAPAADQSSRPSPPAPPAAVPERAAQRPGVAAAPAVRKLAAELGVDLAAVTGTGPNGRITEADVRAAANSAPPKGR